MSQNSRAINKMLFGKEPKEWVYYFKSSKSGKTFVIGESSAFFYGIFPEDLKKWKVGVENKNIILLKKVYK